MANAQETTQSAPWNNKTITTMSKGSETYENLLAQAEKLVKSGNAAAAYALLEPLEFEHSGDEHFDYLIGIAALDSGKPDKATLAFERILMLNPYSAAARMEMARAYFQLGDFPRAKTEFETVLQLDASAEAPVIVQKYLDEIELHESGTRTRLGGYLEGLIGNDSNINHSSSLTQVFVDAATAYINLDPDNIKTNAQYNGISAGGKITHRQNNKLGWFAATDIRQRNYFQYQNFNTLSMDASAGMTFDLQAEHLQLSLLGGQYHLGGARYSEAAGAKGEWRHEFSPSNQLSLIAQQTRYSFADVAMQPNDFLQQAGSAGWIHVFADGKSSVSAHYYFGSEQDISTLVTATTPDGGRIDGARSFNGLRIGLQSAITAKTTLFFNSGLQMSHYSRTNSLFLRQREDRLFDLTAGSDWHWDKLWTLRTQLYYSRNDSNIEVYSYDKTDISLTVRRNFR